MTLTEKAIDYNILGKGISSFDFGSFGAYAQDERQVRMFQDLYPETRLPPSCARTRLKLPSTSFSSHKKVEKSI
jgi:hypothetical protein